MRVEGHKWAHKSHPRLDLHVSPSRIYCSMCEYMAIGAVEVDVAHFVNACCSWLKKRRFPIHIVTWSVGILWHPRNPKPTPFRFQKATRPNEETRTTDPKLGSHRPRWAAEHHTVQEFRKYPIGVRSRQQQNSVCRLINIKTGSFRGMESLWPIHICVVDVNFTNLFDLGGM